MFDVPIGAGWLDPFRDFARVRQGWTQRELPGRLEFPLMNIWAGQDGLIVTAQVPGVKPEALDITIQQNTLTLKGRREPEPAMNAEAMTYHRQERSYGSFTRTIALPFRIDPDKVAARFDDGILTVDLPRPESDKPRRIPIGKA